MFGKSFVNRAESILGTYRDFFLRKHRSGVHPGVEEHNRDARQGLARQYGALDGGGPPVARQKRPVDVQGSEKENVKERLGNKLSESHHHSALRTVCPDLFDNFAATDAFGLVYRNPSLIRQGFDRRFTDLAAPAARAVGLGDYKADPSVAFQQFLKTRHGKIRSPKKD
jgi:hypothetical protein